MKALILGIGGQDGSYLADVLLERGYEVHGLYRRSSVDNLPRIQHLTNRVCPKILLHKGDLLDPLSISRVLNDVQPDEVYNEADQDHIDWSYELPAYSMDVTARGVANLLEAVRTSGRKMRVFQPISMSVFGDAAPPQNERTPFNPCSPYAIAKLAAYHLCHYYRTAYAMHISTALFSTHDSPRRGDGYLLHRICDGAKRVATGQQDQIPLGGADDLVDLGYARDYMEAAADMMQLDHAVDLVIGSGIYYSIRCLAEQALLAADVDPRGKIKDAHDWNRPGPTQSWMADVTEARRVIGYAPKHDAVAVVKMLMEAR